MRAKLARLVPIIAVVLVVGTLSLGDRGQVATDSAVVTSLYGDVQCRHGAAGYAPGKLNEVLKPGDAIKTGADSRAEISVGDGGYVRMNENSQLLITYIRSGGVTSFQALVGGIWVTLERALAGGSKFEVQMPSAVASVKGTVFRCEVSEDGESTTYVYDGEVELTAGDEQIAVGPAQCARVPRNLQIAMARTNLALDDESPWVTYNRHRDILQHLGNPTVMVALSERGIQAGRGDLYVASATLAAELKRHGIVGASVTPADEANFTIGPNGLVQWRRKPPEDYCIVGHVQVLQVRELKPDLFAARVQGKAMLVEDGDAQAIATVDATNPGVGETERAAVSEALRNLGIRLGQEMAPRIIKELMTKRQGALRIDITGGDREQIEQLRELITAMAGTVRTMPLRLPGGRLSLAVAGDINPDQLAQAIRERGGNMIEMVRALDRVVYVRFKGADRGPRGQIGNN